MFGMCMGATDEKITPVEIPEEEKEKYPEDIIGRPFMLGDRVCYPVRYGSHMHVETGRFEGWEKKPHPYAKDRTEFVMLVRKDSGKIVKTTRIDRVAIIEKVSG